ncbi:MAG: hypothetical protein RIF33_05035 [Cyclobacteriaceae bacterium]
MKRTIVIILLLSSVFLLSCDNKKDENEPEEKLRYFEFTVLELDESYNFYAASSDIELLNNIDVELSIPFKDRAHHINGMVDSGNGGYNKDFDWHFIPNQWELTQVSIELCDGYPANLEGRTPYNSCPWTSKLLEEVFL